MYCLIVPRNKDIKTSDETFWEKSFAFHTTMKTPESLGIQEASDTSVVGKKRSEYDTKDWAPKILQPVLQEVVLIGKSMEMFEGLLNLAEEHDRRGIVAILKGALTWFMYFSWSFF